VALGLRFPVLRRVMGRNPWTSSLNSEGKETIIAVAGVSIASAPGF